jgi:hypothetical protein
MDASPTNPAGAAPPAPPRAGAPASVCPVCRTACDFDAINCSNCLAPHHRECWDYNGGCGTYGCPSAPPTQKLTDIEIPASFWDQSEKECPACRTRIQAAALRCRFCGTVFSTARPQEEIEFRQERLLGSDLPKLRRRSIWLLVFAIVPFTSALALLFGGIWYSFNRTRLAALPPAQRAIATIALGVAGLQTLLLIAAILLSELHGH